MQLTNMVVVAHPDDEILGFGATGAKLVEAGEAVQPVILCGDVRARHKRPEDEELFGDILEANRIVGFTNPELGPFPNLHMNTVPHLELVQYLEANIAAIEPARIFTHHPGDPNDDHRQVARSCLAACRLFQRRSDVRALRSLHFMEVQSATDWAIDSSLRAFRPNLFVEIDRFLDKKITALGSYRNVMRDYPHPRSDESIRGLAAYRGSQSGHRHAEAFETVFQRELY